MTNVHELFHTPLKVSRVLTILLVLVGAGVLMVPLMPALRSRPNPRQERCVNNMKQIALALLNYDIRYGRLPPAYIVDKNGKPTHSWRVLILPFLEQESLYKEYDFSEPWNGPHNSRLMDKGPGVFHCPSAANRNSSATNYVAVVGDATLWPGNRSVRFEDIKDGAAKTIMLVEVADSDINWMEPRDMSFDQAVVGVNVDKQHGISSNHGGGVSFAFVDGHIDFLPDSISPATLRALLTIAGGEKIEMGQDGTFSVCPPATTTPSVPRSGEL